MFYCLTLHWVYIMTIFCGIKLKFLLISELNLVGWFDPVHIFSSDPCDVLCQL